jgi:predicted lipoprotein with Yx(FWY)xxD motif
MKHALIIGLVAASVAVLAGAAAAAAKSHARPAKVATGHTALGRIIVDPRGRSLYLFEKDRHGRSACSGLCVTYWPPLLTKGKPVAIKGAKKSLIGSVRRANGKRQVTYAGHPLYFYAGDSGRGQTKGQGLDDFGASWNVLTPSGKEIG